MIQIKLQAPIGMVEGCCGPWWHILCPKCIVDTALLAVDNTLMDHRIMFHQSNLPDCWVSLPSTQAIATGSDVCIPQEQGAVKRTQEDAVADKKKTP